MSSFINFNGSFLPSGTPLFTADNQGFRYGDGLFETIRVEDGRIILSPHHFDRLLTGARLLQFEPLPSLAPEKLTGEILGLCKRNGHSSSARVRLAVFRGEGKDDQAFPHYVIQSWALDAGGLNDKGLVLGVFPEGRKSCDSLSNLKSNNYLLYSMAARYARQQQWDDCLVLNSQDRVADSSIANLFYYNEGIIYTPSLSEGCVAGVMRRLLIETLPAAGFRVVEKPVTPAMLLDAEEVFLTNAIRGVRWVGSFGGMNYANKVVQAVKKVVDENLG